MGSEGIKALSGFASAGIMSVLVRLALPLAPKAANDYLNVLAGLRKPGMSMRHRHGVAETVSPSARSTTMVGNRRRQANDHSAA